MGEFNCQQCQYRHEDNGNCTAIGGFCTAVPAAHCRLLREYLSTGSTPKEVTGIFQKACAQARKIEDGLNADNYSIDRMVELMKADKEGRVLVLPDIKYCEQYGWQNITWDKTYGICAGSHNTREEAEKALEARNGNQ